jgi:hypothetical protein
MRIRERAIKDGRPVPLPDEIEMAFGSTVSK